MAEAEQPPAETWTRGALRSPFISVYELDGDELEASYDHPVREAYAALVDELHDDELDEALSALQSHARALHDEQLASGLLRPEADRLVAQHFAPLIRESEAMVDAMAQLASRDEAAFAGEIDSFVASYAPSTGLDPELEHFFGGLVRKIGRAARAAASTAWQGIRKVALGPVLRAIRDALKSILTGVLQRAIGKLPEPVQPAAQKLARKLGLPGPDPAAAAAASGTATEPAASSGSAVAVHESAGQGAATVQQELDEQLAGAMLAQDEVELQSEAAQLRMASAAASPVFAELDDARERFIDKLAELGDGESAAPLVQEFLPAVLPALRLGVRLIGRRRVIDFLSELLARLIGKLIGPGQAPALSRAIVDAGFKLLHLELPQAEAPRLAAASVAATVEDTIGRVASLPDYVLDHPELLEGFALEAFEQAAAANLPAVLSQATYRQRPELLEAGVNAGWVLLPLRGRKRYKRCTRVFKVTVSPHMAAEVESFEGAPLSDYLHDQLGLADGSEVDAQLHLYEALPGTSLADMARGEREVFGGGLSDEANTEHLHPFTPEAATVLLGKPGLGRAWSATRHGLAAGQRLFHLSIAGQRPLIAHGAPRRHRLRRRLHIRVTLDRPNDRVRVCVFVSEVKAQKLAVALRDPSHVGAVATGFHRWISGRLDDVLLGSGHGLRVVHAALRPGPVPHPALAAVPETARQVFRARLVEWLVRGFADFLRSQAPRFLAATEDPADGVTLRFLVEHPQGLKELLHALVERGSPADAIIHAIAGAEPAVRVDVFPGHRCG